MRSQFKKLVQWLLGERMRRALVKNNATVILLLGKKFRSVFRDEIFDLLKERYDDLVVNAPGYNYRLGIPLTVLGFDSGYQSIYKWILLLFKKPKAISKHYILEFNFGENVDLDVEFIKKYLMPKIILVSDIEDEDSSKIDKLIKAVDSSVITITPDQLDEKSIKADPNKFGRHYLLAKAAGLLVLNNLSGGDVAKK